MPRFLLNDNYEPETVMDETGGGGAIEALVGVVTGTIKRLLQQKGELPGWDQYEIGYSGKKSKALQFFDDKMESANDWDEIQAGLDAFNRGEDPQEAQDAYRMEKQNMNDIRRQVKELVDQLGSKEAAFQAIKTQLEKEGYSVPDSFRDLFDDEGGNNYVSMMN